MRETAVPSNGRCTATLRPCWAMRPAGTIVGLEHRQELYRRAETKRRVDRGQCSGCYIFKAFHSQEPGAPLPNLSTRYNSKRVGRRRPPIQLGLALAPALTRCLSLRTVTPTPIDSRHLTGTGALAPIAGAPLSNVTHRSTIRIVTRHSYLTHCAQLFTKILERDLDALIVHLLEFGLELGVRPK